MISIGRLRWFLGRLISPVRSAVPGIGATPESAPAEPGQPTVRDAHDQHDIDDQEDR